MDATFAQALVRMVIGLLAIVMLLVVVYLIFRKKGLLVAGASKGRLISVVERQYLSPKTYLAHVEWAGKALLIAVTPTGVYVIREADEVLNGRPSTSSQNNE